MTTIWRIARTETRPRTAAEFCTDLNGSGFCVRPAVVFVLRRAGLVIPTGKTELQLGVITAGEICIGQDWQKHRGLLTLEEILYKAQNNHGKSLCPPHAALHLRMHYKDQPVGQRLLVASEEIVDCRDRSRRLLSLNNENGAMTIEFYDGGPDSVWWPGTQLVFGI